MTKWIPYQVNAGPAQERRFCKESDVRLRDESYKKIGENLFEDRNNPDMFPRHEWERTPFSFDMNKKYDSNSYEQLINWMDYVFWDSSTEFMLRMGMPTKEDVNVWIEYVKDRKDFTDKQITSLVGQCQAYLQEQP